jgi:hypothetical protein
VSALGLWIRRSIVVIGMAGVACAASACGLSLAGSLGKSDAGPDPLDAQLESSDDATADDAGTEEDATSDGALDAADGALLDAPADVSPDTGACPAGTVRCVWCLVATATVTQSTCEPVATAPCLDNAGTKPVGADYCPCADPSPANCPAPDQVCAGTGGGAHGCRPCGGMGTDNKTCKANGNCDGPTYTCK